MSTLTITSLIDTGVSLTVPVVVTATGTVTAPGTVAVTDGGQFGTLSNAGTISGEVLGVSLGLGGTIDNLAGGGIYGAAGIVIQGLGELDNAGVIAGAGTGVILGTAAVTNQLSGEISGGVVAGSGTVTNEGTIARAAGDLISFSNGGTVLNLGTAAALTGGDVTGVAIYGGAGSVDNEGAISGILLDDGGTISNSGYVAVGSASSGITIAGASGVVENTGTILGVSLTAGGQIYNQLGGTVTGYLDGIDLAAGGTVVNYGRVLGIGARLSAVEPGLNGISLTGAGVLDNEAGALIRGSNDGVKITGTGGGSVTLVNDGTIIGKKGVIVDSSLATTIIDNGTIAGTNGTAIAFEAGDDTLILGSSAVLQGIIVGGDTAQGGATLTLEGPLSSGSGGIELLAGGNLEVTGSMAAAQTISFAGTDASLMIGDLNQFQSEVAGLNSSDTIDLANDTFDPSGYATLTTGNVLDIVGNNTTMSLQLDPTQNFTGEFFHISSDGLNGTDITENAVPCFLAGTRIATGDGEVAVEALRIGDTVLTGGGAAKPVKWIGRRRYTAPLPDDPDVIPVLIEAGALADGIPAADLYISPRHAVRIGAHLVPAGALINGVSVRACPEIATIAYYHVELESHETILANGAEAETFIDHDSRRMFENAEEFYRLYPNAWATEVVLCAPRLEFGPELEAARRSVALRAGLLPGQDGQAPVIGFLERADRATIAGWAYAPGQPNVPVILDIYNRGARLARTVANGPRPDVKGAGFGHGRCGFSLTLPAPLPALQRHEITVRPAGGSTCLVGGPIVIDPAIAHDLIAAGGLQTLIDAALAGLGPGRAAATLGSSLEAAGRRIRLTAGAPPRPRQPARSGGPVALLLDTAWPTVTRDAGSNAIMSHAEAFLRLGYDVAFCATSGAPQDEDAAAGLDALQQRGVRCFGHDGGTAEDALRSLGAGRLDVVYLHRLAAASAYGGLVRRHAPVARVIYAVADLHHVRLARQAAVANRPDLAAKARSVKAAELWAMQLADCVLTHSRAEAAYLRREAPRANVHVVPWAVAARPMPSGRNRNDIAFIGGAGHAPNADALAHLARDILPAVWREIPSLRCLVAGAGWSRHLFGSADPRLVDLGHQPDLRPVLRGVRLTVAPLRFGAGIKGKVLDSLAAGVPCVMSEIAAEGLPLDPRLRGAVGDGPDFVRHVLSIYRDRKQSRVLSRAGLDLIETEFSTDAVVDALERALGRTAGSAPGRAGASPAMPPATDRRVLQDA